MRCVALRLAGRVGGREDAAVGVGIKSLDGLRRTCAPGRKLRRRLEARQRELALRLVLLKLLA